MSPDVLEELQQCIKMQQLFQECIKSDKDRKGLPREAPGDLLYHRSSSLVGVVVRLGTSRGTARNEPRGVHPNAGSEKLPRQSLAPTGNLKTNVVHGAENPFMAGRMEEHTDTGSNISIIRPDVLSEKEQTRIQPVSQSICTVTGEKAP